MKINICMWVVVVNVSFIVEIVVHVSGFFCFFFFFSRKPQRRSREVLEVSSSEEDTTTNTIEIPVDILKENNGFFNLQGVRLDGMCFC